jgi:hypothetical protein
MSKKLTARQASLRGAFKNSYPTCVVLAELVQSAYFRPAYLSYEAFKRGKAYHLEVIVALIKGMPYRAVGAHFGVSLQAVYSIEIKFYAAAERFFNRTPSPLPPHTYRKSYNKVPPVPPSDHTVALIKGLPLGYASTITKITKE